MAVLFGFWGVMVIGGKGCGIGLEAKPKRLWVFALGLSLEGPTQTSRLSFSLSLAVYRRSIYNIYIYM